MNLQFKEVTVNSGGFSVFPEQSKPIDVYKSPTGKTVLGSAAIAAILLFFVVNFAFKLLFRPDPFSLPERSFIWWAVKDYRQLNQAPDVLLFGSSLMLAAVNEGDATKYRKLVDTAVHHRSYYLEELLKKRYNQNISTFCFAIGGQMASDVYSIATNFITEKFKPRMIIWGIAPRDLVDSAFPGPMTSDTAQYMNKIAGKEIVSDDHKTFVLIADQLLSHALYLYREREDLTALLRRASRRLQIQQTAWLLASNKNTTNEVNAPIGRSTMLRELMNPRDGTMGDIEVGEWMIGANAEPSKTLKDNTHEYMMRYNPFKPKTFIAQRHYLQTFLKQQQELGVKVVLLNMPLTGVNMSLLPGPTYDMYLNTLRDSAAMYGAEVIDLNGDPRFAQSYFFDTAHLNGLGAEKLIEVLSADKKFDYVCVQSALASSNHTL